MTEDVGVMVWADLVSLKAADAKAAAEKLMKLVPNQGDPEQQMEEMNEGLNKYSEFREKFLAAGGKGMLMMVSIPMDEMAEEPEPALLVQVSPGADHDALVAAMKSLDEDGDADDFELLTVAPGWLAASGDDFGPVAKAGEAKYAKVFESAMAAHGGTPVRAAIRITDAMRAKMKEGLNQAQNDGGGNPMAGMVTGVLQTVLPLEAIGVGGHLGASPAILASMEFPSAAEAGDFLEAYTSVLTFGKQMMVAQIRQMGDQGPPDMPGEAEVRQVFDALKMTQDGKRLSLKIDETDMAAGGKMVPMVMMFMMMGGGGM
ncbi:MAG: hypothetical protein AAGF86_21190 [Pseudomonadota bacterium]